MMVDLFAPITCVTDSSWDEDLRDECNLSSSSNQPVSHIMNVKELAGSMMQHREKERLEQAAT